MGKHTSKPSYYLQFPPEGSASPAADRDTTRLVWLIRKRRGRHFGIMCSLCLCWFPFLRKGSEGVEAARDKGGTEPAVKSLPSFAE